MEGKKMIENKIPADIRKAIFDYDKEGLMELVKKSLEQNVDPLEIFKEMMVSIREVGDLFNSGELFLPDLIAASDTMQSALPVLEEEMKKKGVTRKTEGTVVIGTVFGDVHNIGKNMVATLLSSEGFEVKDAGVNVPADKFLDAIKDNNADILAMSALLTTTMKEQEKVISMLKQKKLRDKIKIMIGGAPITEEFSKNIGADGYAPSAPAAVKLAKKLMSK
jgi:corrinoid protein of di/trimethylamine methyltransferase